ncbi:MAG TPA: spore protein [Bacteroidia bacterium]
MAVTRLKRKDRRNKEMTRVRKTNLKNVNKMLYIQSPYKGESGIVLEDQA